MSLENIQNLMVNLVISHHSLHRMYAAPKEFQENFALSDEEIQFALKMPRRTIGSFQMSVANKRIRRSQADRYIGRTMGYMSSGQRGNAMRSFISNFPMKQNEWLERVPDFLELVEKEVFFEDTPADHVNIDIIKFERWVYDCATQETSELPQGNGFVRSPNVSITRVPFPVEPLISSNTSESNFTQLVNSHGTEGFVLIQKTSQGFDLYEIDKSYFEILVCTDNVLTADEFDNLANRIAEQHGVDKSGDDILAELIDIEILVQVGEEM